MVVGSDDEAEADVEVLDDSLLVVGGVLSFFLWMGEKKLLFV